jgi:hypothetical protein
MFMEIPEITDIFKTYTTYERYIKAITTYYQQLTNLRLDNNYIDYRIKMGFHYTTRFF